MNGGLLNSESHGITIPAIILAVSSVISRLLGILRDWLLSERFGAGTDLDVYFAAFRIPDLIYNLLVFGGVVVAFLPLFSDYYARNKEAAWRFANNTLNVFLGLLVLASAVLFIFTPQFIEAIAPGFNSEQLEKTIFLSRMMFLSPIIFGIASIFSGVLQYFRKFLAYSMAASLYNLGIIIGILFLSPYLGITGVAVGVIIGALMYLLIQVIPAVECGFCYKPIFNLKEPSLRRISKLMLPRTLGIAANQINLIIPTAIGSTLAVGSIAIFNLANNIYSIPVGIIGISWATAAFASFSKSYTEGKLDELAEKFAASYRQIGFFVIPASFLLFASRQPVVDILYYHGQFDYKAALLTSATLGVFCLGIYFASMMPVIFRLFFSIRDTATPTWSTLISVAANIILNYVFVGMMAGGDLAITLRQIFGIPAGVDISVLGLALAFSVANILQFAVLAAVLVLKKEIPIRFFPLFESLLKTYIAGIFMAVAVYLLSNVLPSGDTIRQLINLIIILSVAGIAYFLAVLILKSPELDSLRLFLKNKLR